MPIFQLLPGFSTTWLPKFCYKPISVIHFWKAYNAYFLKSFVGGTLFSNKSIIFRCLNLKTRFLTIFSGQCLIKHKCIFLRYLNPHQPSRWLILKLISMPWQQALQTVGLSTWNCWQEQCKLRQVKILARKK